MWFHLINLFVNCNVAKLSVTNRQHTIAYRYLDYEKYCSWWAEPSHINYQSKKCSTDVLKDSLLEVISLLWSPLPRCFQLTAVAISENNDILTWGPFMTITFNTITYKIPNFSYNYSGMMLQNVKLRRIFCIQVYVSTWLCNTKKCERKSFKPHHELQQRGQPFRKKSLSSSLCSEGPPTAEILLTYLYHNVAINDICCVKSIVVKGHLFLPRCPD